MARISLVPQKREFFVLYSRAARNAVEIARLLVELLDEFPQDGNRLRDIKELEHEGDRLTRELVDLLNRTFVTPFDRDDMYRLATALDDICDHVDEAADNIDAYEVKQIPDLARRQLIELRTLEDEGDRLSREAISQLFAGDPDAVSLVRWKDIHEQLEEAIDACENAADVLEAIFVKNR